MSDVMEPFLYKLGVEVPHDVIFVTVHPSVKILPNDAFDGRRQLKKVLLPEGLEEIGWSSFYSCASLEQINYPTTLIKILGFAFQNCRLLKEVTLPEGLEEIGRNAFRNCVSLEHINFPSTLIKIVQEAFTSCRSLKDVTLPEGLEEIGGEAFSHCKSLEHINYPSSLINIGHFAFCHCHSLKEVDLVEGLEEIGGSAFSDCESLERINYPSSLIKIGDEAFTRCPSLAKVTLAGGIVTIIEVGAFRNCPSLEGVTIQSKAFVIEVELEVDSNGDSDSDSDGNSGDDVEVFTCRLVLTDDGTTPLTEAEQMIVSPERLNYISLCDLLELQLENRIVTIMSDRGRTREESIERVLALIKSRALFEVSTILELALWKNKMDAINDSNPGTRADRRVRCGADIIIPGVLLYL